MDGRKNTHTHTHREREREREQVNGLKAPASTKKADSLVIIVATENMQSNRLW